MKTTLLAALLVLAPLARADVLVVDAGGGGDFTTLTAAVAAALDGDVLLVKEGFYAEPAPVVIDGKALHVVGDVSGTTFGSAVEIQPGLVVQDLPAGRHVVLENLVLYGTPSTSTTVAGSGLVLLDNVSHIRIEGCSVYGGGGADNANPDGATALLMDGSLSLAFVDSVANGGPGQFSPDLGVVTGHGGVGISKVDGQLALVASGSVGGYGGSNLVGGWPTGGHGGTGLLNLSGPVFMQASSASGGEGGTAHNGGDGGAGLHNAFPGTVTMMGGSWTDGGSGGWSDDGPDGSDGADTIGVAVDIGGILRDFNVTSPVREGGVGEVDFAGSVSETALLMLSFDMHLIPFPSAKGLLLLSPTTLLGPYTIGPPGNLDVPFTVPELGPGLEAVVVHLQAAYIGAGGAQLGSSAVVTMLDGSF